jgi:hypothetical protein
VRAARPVGAARPVTAARTRAPARGPHGREPLPGARQWRLRHHLGPQVGRREFVMIRRQRNKLVEVRADLILADEIEAYATHFEAQMRRSKVRKLLSSYLRFGRTGAVMPSFDPIGIWQPPSDCDT